MMTHSDLAGNLIGRLDGKHAWPPLLIGAHIDRTSADDHCRGFAGIMAAVEVARTLHDNGTVLDHPLEIIVWTDSAGRMLGSRSFHDVIPAAELRSRLHGGMTVADGIAFLGGDPDNLLLNQRAAGRIATYLEMQIDPDPAQRSSSAAPGSVQQFAGIRSWSVRLVSNSDTSDISPQNRRVSDAASRFSAAIADLEQLESDPIATMLRLAPTSAGTSNDNTDDVGFHLDIHAYDMERIDRLFAAVRGHAARIGAETGTRIIMQPILQLESGTTDQQVAEAMAKAATQLGLPYVHRRGIAAHDAQGLTTLAAVGLITVPGGTNNRESGSGHVLPEALANGTNTLLRTLLELDKQAQERSR